MIKLSEIIQLWEFKLFAAHMLYCFWEVAKAYNNSINYLKLDKEEFEIRETHTTRITRIPFRTQDMCQIDALFQCAFGHVHVSFQSSFIAIRPQSMLTLPCKRFFSPTIGHRVPYMTLLSIVLYHNEYFYYYLLTSLAHSVSNYLGIYRYRFFYSRSSFPYKS